jgi:hypothetical protein
MHGRAISTGVATPRKLFVDGVDFGWTRRHEHQAGPCSENLSIWRADKTGGRLLVRFVDGQGGATTTGSGWGGHDGGLICGSRSYNLNRPGVIAALIRQALREGWDSRSKVDRELEGFALLARSHAPRDPG